MEFIILAILIIIIATTITAVKIVPQQNVWIVEKLGKYSNKLEAGLHLITPFIEKVAYKHTFKEDTIQIPGQAAITNDNVSITISGMLYVKTIDPVAASYGVSNPYYAIEQLAKTTMRSVIGKMKLDRTFEERENINTSIVIAINEAAINWGIQCMRYEIIDIQTPQTVAVAMELQVAAERKKRAEILESEGKRQSQINLSEAYKQEIVLKSEAEKIQRINQANGEAEAITLVANAQAKSLEVISRIINETGGKEAVSLRLADEYIKAFGNLAKHNNTMIVPSNVADVSSFIAQATSMFRNVKNNKDE